AGAVKLLPVVVAILVAGSLAGCTGGGTDAGESPTASAPSPTPSPTASALPGAEVITGLSFAQGDELGTDASEAPTFINLFADDDSWSQADTTDPEHGYWQYVSADEKCAVSLSQLLI